MKNKLLKAVFAVAFAVVSFPASAQAYLTDPRYGDTPEERQANVLTLNFFSDAYNNKDYDLGTKYMKELWEKAPRASENIYINGANIYKNRIARSTSLQQRDTYVDSLMMVYDMRVKNFGDHPQRGRAYVMGLKARDYLSFKGRDLAGVKRLFTEAIDAAGPDADLDLVNIYFKAVTDGYKDTAVEVDDVFAVYEKYSPLFEGDDEARNTFDALFASSGAADCETLEQVFSGQIADNPDDQALIARVFGTMSRAKCTSDFYMDVAEKYYATNPSSDVAMALAAIFEEKKEYSRALKYLNEAAANETDASAKSNLYVRAAGAELGARNSSSAASYARKALEVNPENGYGQMLLAQAYVMGSNGCSGFDRQTVYWLVYDMLAKARGMIDDEDIQRSIDSQMGTYRASFPSKEECFFRGLNNGQGYSVRCGWVSGTTTVRQGQ